jgi:DNA-binding MarR family transcriptional regulator
MNRSDDSLGFLLADVSRLMRRAFQQQLAGHSTLTLAQARALGYLARREGLRQVDLADLLDVQPITLARLIDQLVQHGLVERRPDPDDRRAHRLYLTPAAAPQLALIRRAAEANYASALTGVEAEQMAILSAVLRKMRDNLSSR